MKRPLVGYHANCADGFAAAWCFWRVFKDAMEYCPLSYSMKEENLPDFTDREVYLVDFSFKREKVKEILKVAKKVVLIDHHKSAIEDLAGLPGLIQYISLERSGAVLAWMYVENELRAFSTNEPIPPVLAMIEDRDLWQFKWKQTKPLSEYLFAHEYDFEVWDKLIMASEEKIAEMVSAGEILQKKHMKDVEEIIRVSRREMFIGGIRVPVVNTIMMMASDTGGFLAREAPFAATYSDGPDGRYFSLRSSKDNPNHLDVSTIAVSYGGGGHKHAAGFKVPRDHELAMA